MPNIEIHGFLDFNEARKLRQTVFALFKDEPFVDDMVVEIYPTDVGDRHDKSQPFFRLTNSREEHSEKILNTLYTLGLDIEYPPKLKKFIPKKQP